MRCLRYATAVLGLVLPVFSQTSSGEAPTAHHGLVPLPDFDDPASRSLSGDWGGVREEWAESGVQVDVVWSQYALGVLDGGKDTGWRYGGKLSSFWRFDLDRMGFVPGAFVSMSTESRYGQSVNGMAGTLLPVNDGMYFPLTGEPDEDLLFAITELRYTQFLSPELAVFGGKFVVLGGEYNEFAGGRGETQFLSHAFVSPSVTALVNPYSTVGGGVQYMPAEDVVIVSSLYASTDASTTSGLSGLDDGLTWSTSVRNQYEWNGLPGGMMLTGQYGFDNEFVDFRGQFVNDGSFQVPLQGETWNAFWNGWQYVSVDESASQHVDVTNGRTDLRGWGVFARMGVADPDTNPARFVLSGGVGGRGVGSREFDSYGIGYSLGVIGDVPSATGLVLNDDGHRAETYYSLAIDPGAELTFDVQYGDSVRAGVDSALVAGFRLRLQF